MKDLILAVLSAATIALGAGNISAYTINATTGALAPAVGSLKLKSQTI
jgi:hypothetical protein